MQSICLRNHAWRGEAGEIRKPVYPATFWRNPSTSVRSSAAAVSNEGEAAPGLAGACRLDRGVEREQIGLAGDVLDQLDYVADLLRGLRQAADLLVGRPRFPDRDLHQAVGLGKLPADIGDRGRHFLGGPGGDLDV